MGNCVTLAEFAEMCRKCDPAKSPDEARALLSEAAKIADVADKLKMRIAERKAAETDCKLKMAAEVIDKAVILADKIIIKAEQVKPKPQKKRKAEKAATKSSLFDEFWAAYPKKRAKQDALKAWERLKPTRALADKILSSLDDQKRSEEWQRDGGQFIPYPATWLNGGRWEDEPVVSVKAAAADSGHSYDLNKLLEHAINNVPKIEGDENV